MAKGDSILAAAGGGGGGGGGEEAVAPHKARRVVSLVSLIFIVFSY